MSTFHIISPKGDRKQLYVIELSDAGRYELNDYAVASRREFKESEKEECISYAKQLAKDNNLIYAGDDDGYLD